MITRSIRAVLISFVFFSNMVRAVAVDEVYFAGFSFVSDYEAISEQFPFTSSLAEEEGGLKLIDKRLRSLIESNQDRYSITVNLADLAGLKSGNAVVLCLALEQETAYVEKIGDVNRLVAQLSAQALYFDFETKSIVGSFPISIQYIYASKEEISEEKIRSIFAEMYSEDGQVSLLKELDSHLSDVSLKRQYNATIQVAQVSLSDSSLQWVPDELKKKSRINKSIGQTLSKLLSSNQRISVLPYSPGVAIGGKMTARFADGSVYNLSVPEADYTILVDVLDFKKAKYSESVAGTAWLYGSFINFSVIEPFSGEIYADFKVKNGLTKVAPSSQSDIEDWPVFFESLEMLFDKLTLEITAPSKSWAKMHTPSSDNVKQIKKIKEVIERCR